jgi:hypothetical protein
VTNDAPRSFPVGTNVVTWKVTDTSGNEATCQQTVTVSRRVTPPPQNLVVLGHNAASAFCLGFTGGSCGTYRIEACEQLGERWVTLTELPTEVEPGVYCFEDASTVEHPNRLYRVRAD